MLNDIIDELVGKTIKSVKIGDKSVLEIEDDSGTKHYLEAEADCCSESWFCNFFGDCVNLKILSIKEEDLPDIEPATRQDTEQVHRYTFVGDGKRAWGFELHNGSNGYYDGSLSYCNNKRLFFGIKPFEDLFFKKL